MLIRSTPPPQLLSLFDISQIKSDAVVLARLLWVTADDFRLDLNWYPLSAYLECTRSYSGSGEPFKAVLSILLPGCHLYLCTVHLEPAALPYITAGGELKWVHNEVIGCHGAVGAIEKMKYSLGSREAGGRKRSWWDTLTNRLLSSRCEALGSEHGVPGGQKLATRNSTLCGWTYLLITTWVFVWFVAEFQVNWSNLY